MEKKRLYLPSEVAYFIVIAAMSLSVAMVATSDFGVSMIVAPAYLLSLKTGILSFGVCEYIVQGILFITFCILMKKVKLTYFCSFLTCVIYGAALDLWRRFLPGLNPEITVPGSMSMYVRVIYFAIGTLITSFSVALSFRIYLYPQVYDFFVKGVCEKYSLNRKKFKTIFDMSFLLAAAAMTFAFFGEIKGLGIGTVITTFINGTLIDISGKIIDRFFEIRPASEKLAKKFEIE